MRRLFAALGTCGLAIGVAVGNPPAPAPTAVPTVSELVTRLGAHDFRDREAAVAHLEKSGASAIPALREAANSPDPEVRQRASAILFKLQRTADSTGLIAPKKVTLTYRDMPLGTALTDLKTRTGLNIVLDTTRVADPLRKVTCVTGEVPLWDALEQFCAAAGLQEAHRLELDVPKQPPTGRRGYVASPAIPNADAVPVVLIDGKDGLPGARATAVRIVALPKSFPGHRVTLGTGETTMCFDVLPTPGLNWQDVVAVKITKLTDDAGRAGGAGSIKSAPANNFEFDGVVAWGGGGFGGPGGFGGRFDPRTGMPIPPDSLPNPRIVAVPLKLATPNARSIKRLEGHVLGEVMVANQTLITVPDPAKNTHTAFDGPGQMRLTVTAVSEAKGNAGVTVQVTLQYPSPWAVSARRGLNPGGIWPEAPRGAGQTPTVKAFDAKGKEMLARTSNGAYSDSSDDGLTMFQNYNLTFAKDAGVPAKLTLVGPRAVVVEVPFVLENVPLP